MSLGDGLDSDPNSVRQRVRIHKLGEIKMQAHVYRKETVRSELDGRTPSSQQYIQQQYNSSGAARTDQSITAAYRVSIRQCSGTPVVLWYARSWVGFALFLRFSTFRGRSLAVPGRDFSCPALAELGLVGVLEHRAVMEKLCRARPALSSSFNL